MKDIFDLEVERLQAIPDEEFEEKIFDAWSYSPRHSILFDCICSEKEWENPNSGCLTQIRLSPKKVAYINGAENKEITEQIRNDERIPEDSDSITKESLPVFAEWQRKIKILNNLSKSTI